jgi:hypothetical protein
LELWKSSISRKLKKPDVERKGSQKREEKDELEDEF